jgi:hypothetical protein
MAYRGVWLMLLGACLALPGPARAQAIKSLAQEVRDLSLEVDALQTLYFLELTPAQLKALVKLADKTAAKPKSVRPVKISKQFYTTLTSLRAALIKGDDDRVSALSDRLDELKAGPEEWKKRRDGVAEEIGWLLAGFGKDKAQKYQDRAAALLDKAHAWTEDELKKNGPVLEAAVQELLGDIGPLDILRNLLQRDLAELLSNPRLASAVEALLK